MCLFAQYNVKIPWVSSYSSLCIKQQQSAYERLELLCHVCGPFVSLRSTQIRVCQMLTMCSLEIKVMASHSKPNTLVSIFWLHRTTVPGIFTPNMHAHASFCLKQMAVVIVKIKTHKLKLSYFKSSDLKMTCSRSDMLVTSKFWQMWPVKPEGTT